jgi:REP element-mobilizing transposase RayT
MHATVFLPGIPVYIVQRGHSLDPIFFENSDYQAYLGWLKEVAERYRCDIHAYVLMTNHIHQLDRIDEADQRGALKDFELFNLLETTGSIKPDI